MDDIPGLTWIIPQGDKKIIENSFVVAFGSTYDTVVGPYTED